MRMKPKFSPTELLEIERDLTQRGVGLVLLSMGGERLDTRNPTSTRARWF